ncbi:MAG TPA: DUF2267 domain-containing protein [Chloroflexota bacterium]
MRAVDHVEAFDTTVQKTYEWLHELDEEMGTENVRRAYEMMRAYLHALRDRLPIQEAAQLAAQMPMLLRGVYYEGWRPSHKPDKMHADEFLEYVAREGLLDGPEEAEVAVRASTAVLLRHVSAGEMVDVLSTLPEDIRQILS